MAIHNLLAWCRIPVRYVQMNRTLTNDNYKTSRKGLNSQNVNSGLPFTENTISIVILLYLHYWYRNVQGYSDLLFCEILFYHGLIKSDFWMSLLHRSRLCWICCFWRAPTDIWFTCLDIALSSFPVFEPHPDSYVFGPPLNPHPDP